MGIYDFGVARSYATPQAAFDACQAANETGALGTVVFTGSGLDDLVISGTPAAGLPEYDVRVEIDGAGATDTFKWSLDGGATWEETLVAITGAAQPLGMTGLSATFGATTGHTSGDRWDGATSYASSLFSEINYLRGYGSEVYGGASAGEPALRLVHSSTGRGLAPTRACPLVIDADGTDSIILEDTEDVGALVGGSADGSAVASHVQVSVSVRSATNHAIVINPDRTGGQTAEDWTIDGAVDAAQAAIVAGGCRHLRVRAELSAGAEGCVYADGSSGTYGGFSGVMHLANVVGRSAGSLVNLCVGDCSIQAFHCSAELSGDVFSLVDDSTSMRALTLSNNAFKTAGRILSADAPIHVPYADGNCYFATGDFAYMDGSAIADLSAWQAETGQDPHSIEADPLFEDSSLALADNSPCLQQARDIPNGGFEGMERCLTADQGARQYTDPASVKGSFQNGRLRLQVNGSAPVSGL